METKRLYGQEVIVGPIHGYKMTDLKMQCNGYQFTLGETHTLTGNSKLEMCTRGFHFCENEIGPHYYYNGGRLFEVEAYDVLNEVSMNGVIAKRVCRKIKFVREIDLTSDNEENTGEHNKGYGNTGMLNIGDYNRGKYNTGDRNTGDFNIGDANKGDSNIGHYNQGRYNNGCCNHGNYNVGDYNSGFHNVGSSNTGSYNYGHSNSGTGNIGNNMVGYFCTQRVPVYIFDEPTTEDIDRQLLQCFCQRLYNDAEITDYDLNKYGKLPNATDEKIKRLHKLFAEARKVQHERIP